MLIHIKSVEPLDGYQLKLEFSTGEFRLINLEQHLWGPVFEPLKAKDYFDSVIVDAEAETIVWPNGADFSPAFLYENSTPFTQAVA